MNHVQILENECEFVLWVKIDGKVFNLEQPVIFGTIYIPPEYTRYSLDEAFNQIEHELYSFSTNSKYVGLNGDFNSRTGEDDDYVNVNFEHGDNNIDEFIENHAGILEHLNKPLKRKNIDKTKNKYGNMLLNFCKANQLFIVNTKKCSRIGVRDDKGIGRLACRNYSTANYCISSSYFLKSVVNFTVQDFNCLFSTVQCPPAISFSCNSVKDKTNPESIENNGVARIRKWDVNKQLDFQNNIESSKLTELSDKLENLPHERINPNIIDSLTGDLCNILITSARKTLGSNSGKNHKEKQFLSKPWFDLDCKRDDSNLERPTYYIQSYATLKRNIKTF